ncbi:MAG: tripartite tricarboxylate transporter substrate binding protein [Betaproteobacteria bacterium]|jgi:tripartite-type tricarboxylate transporter receptor subunit TctC|nr:tripartite tricarboxylate transporter substrate binding protein [Betaproteobacteria bacterium]
MSFVHQSDLSHTPSGMQRRQVLRGLTGALATAVLSHNAWAQESFPNRPIRVIVPQPPGGGFDFVARTLADKLGQSFKSGLVVENRTGSGTLVGTELAAKAPADGYTVLTGSVSNLVLNVGLFKNLSYDPLKDFEPIGLAAAYSYTLVARKDLPFATLGELVAYAKANPGRLSYASAGNGSGQHVLAAALWHLAGVQITHVPYRGAQPAYADLLGGRVDVFFDLSSTARVHVDAGSLKALAVSASSRLSMHPTVPTLRETGAAALELESWFGFFAPARTPAPELARWRAEFARVAQSPDVMERFEKAGGRPLAVIGEDARALLRRDLERWVPLMRAAGLQPE